MRFSARRYVWVVDYIPTIIIAQEAIVEFIVVYIYFTSLNWVMSWVKSVPSSGDDVFDEEEDDLSLQNKEWRTNMEKRAKVH